MSLASFLQAMRESPDDRTVRLVFGDWLDENGDPDRGELVRLQCATPRAEWDQVRPWHPSPREEQLIAANRQRWLGDVPAGITVEFLCGMLRIEVQDNTFRNGRACAWIRNTLERGWVDWLVIYCQDGSYPRQIQGWPELGMVAGFRAVVVDGPDDHILSLLPAFSRLRRLDLDDVLLLQRPGIERLGNIASLAGLQSLTWRNGRAGVNFAAQLASLPWFPRLCHLRLPRCGLGNEGLMALLSVLAPDQLTLLDVSANRLTAQGIASLASCEQLRRLTALSLGVNEVWDEGAAALADSPHLRQLQHLKIPLAGITGEGIARLAESDNVVRLRTLDLTQNALRNSGAAALASSSRLGLLCALELEGCGIDEDGARALVLSPNLRRLQHLELGFNPTAALARLLADDHGRVRWQAARALAQMGAAGRDALPALRARQGDSDEAVRREVSEAIRIIEAIG